MFGWDLLFHSVKNVIEDKKNFSRVLIHYTLIDSGFKCCGVGDTSVDASEVLPEGWNAREDDNIKYIKDNVSYSLRMINTEDNAVVFHLMQIVGSMKVTNILINLNDIEEIQGPLLQCVPKWNELFQIIKRDLIFELIGHKAQSTAVQTDDVLYPYTPSDIPRFIPRSESRLLVERSSPRIGRSDLNPFSPGEGGMLFDPFEDRRRNMGPGMIGPRLPRGSRPPGARFDPFGPPDNIFRPRNPFPDFDDNMFM